MDRYGAGREGCDNGQQDRGPAAARNTGVRGAKADYVAVVDSGDAFAPNAISKLVSAFERSGAEWSMVDIVKFWGDHQEIQRCGTPTEDPQFAILADDFIRRMMFFRKTTIEHIGMCDENKVGREYVHINIRLLGSEKLY